MMRFYLFLLLLIMFGSCRNEKKAGQDFNPKRIEIGLPILDPSWKMVDNIDNVIQWSPKNSYDSLAYIAKLVTIKNGKIRREENHYIGKAIYKTIDGNFLERLFISCDLDEAENFISWDCIYRGPEYEHGKTITRAQADSILIKWHLPLLHSVQ